MSCFCKKREDYVWAKGEGYAAVILTPAGDVLIRVGPEEIAEQATVRNLERAVSTKLRQEAWRLNGGGGGGGGCRKEGWETHVGWTHYATDLLHGVQIRAQATVHGEDLLIDDGRNWQAVEAVRKCFPQLDIVAALALVVKPVDAVDGGAFVIAPQDEEIFGGYLIL